MATPQPAKENIVIVGGGIIGCTTAYYLTRHPQYDASRYSITVLEAARIANGASSKAGGLVASWASPDNMAALSFDLHSDLADEHNGADLWGYRRVRCGQLTAQGQVPEHPRRPDPAAVAAAAEEGVDGQVDATATAKGEDHWNQTESNANIQLGKWWIREQMDTSVLPGDLDWFKPDSAQAYEEFADNSSTAQVQPLQFTTAMMGLAEQAGARIVLGTVEHVDCGARDGASIGEVSTPLGSCHDWSQSKVTSVTYTDRLKAEKRTIPASIVILAAGPWTPTLMPRLRMSPLRAHSISIKVERPISAYCLFTEITFRQPSPGGTRQASLRKSSAKTVSPEIYARPNNEVYICSQGDMTVPLPAPTESVAVSAQSCQEIIDAASSVSRELASGVVTARRACYLPTIEAGVTRDPLVGYTGLDGLLLATGHSCWGILNAPATGKILAELIFDGNVTCMDVGNLDPRKVLGAWPA